MSTVQDVTHSSIATSTTKNTTSSSSAGDSSSKIMGKEDFLTLLVAQLKNQDPLNPDDPTAFTAQLAQFSTLEQLTNLNDSMTGLVTSTDNATKLSALGLIGKAVTFSGSSFTYNGDDSVKLGYSLDGPAAEVQLLIQDSNGKAIRTLSGTELTKGNHTLTWDGLDEDGNKMEAGTYKVAVTAKGVDSAGVAASPIITSEVTGVDMSTNVSAILNTKAGDVDFTKILGVFSLGGSSSTQSTPATTTDQSSQAAAESVTDAAVNAATDAAKTVL
jgi:flagellar basal-body rod modification protein FlgD